MDTAPAGRRPSAARRSEEDQGHRRRRPGREGGQPGSERMRPRRRQRGDRAHCPGLEERVALGQRRRLPDGPAGGPQGRHVRDPRVVELDLRRPSFAAGHRGHALRPLRVLRREQGRGGGGRRRGTQAGPTDRQPQVACAARPRPARSVRDRLQPDPRQHVGADVRTGQQHPPDVPRPRLLGCGDGRRRSPSRRQLQHRGRRVRHGAGRPHGAHRTRRVDGSPLPGPHDRDPSGPPAVVADRVVAVHVVALAISRCRLLLHDRQGPSRARLGAGVHKRRHADRGVRALPRRRQ